MLIPSKLNLICFGVGALITILIGCSVYTYGYKSGIQFMVNKNAAETVLWQEKVKEAENRVDVISQQLRDDFTRKIQSLESQNEALRKNPKIVTRYITKEQNTTLPYGLVLWHDRLVRNEPVNTMLPETFKTECDYTQYDLSEVLSTNYTRCNECLAKLSALQGVVRKFMEEQGKITKGKK